MKKTGYTIIANPAAGRGRSSSIVRQVVESFQKRGLHFDLELTKAPGDAARIARESIATADVIVVVGGDGTINEVLPGMLHRSIPLGIIPAGSGNDFVKSLHIPNNRERAIDILVMGRTKTIDLGMINTRLFANGVGIGFDAAVNRASYTINHSRRGLLLYLCALLKTLGRYAPVSARISMNGVSRDQTIFLLSIGNGTTVGGGFRLTPRAVIDDGLLDITLVKPIGLLPLLRHLPKVFTGTIDRATEYAAVTRTSSLVVESNQPIPIHADGEIFLAENNRVEISVVPKALTVIGGF